MNKHHFDFSDRNGGILLQKGNFARTLTKMLEKRTSIQLKVAIFKKITADSV